MENEEFQEEDVWGNSNHSNSISTKESSNVVVSKRLPSAAKMIPKLTPNFEEKRNNNNNNNNNNIQQNSAPQNIPDWSKIYGSSKRSEDDDGGSNNWEGCEMTIPPHEWVARKSRSSFSVCEGVGRTLKGRDLSRVRNAVLIKTGFLESSN